MFRRSLPPLPRLKGLLLLLLVFATLSVAAAVYHGLRLRSEALRAYRDIASNLMRVGERELTSTLTEIDRTLSSHGQNWLALAHSTSGDAQLREDIAKLPALRSISLVDAGGRVLASSLDDLRGRPLSPDALATLTSLPGVPLQVSALWKGRDLSDGLPITGPMDVRSGPYFFTIMYRAAAVGPQPAPWLVATVNADYFSGLLASMSNHPDGVVELYRYDGLLLASTHPDTHPPGTSAASHSVFSQWLPEREIGLIDPDMGPDGPQILAFRASRHYPFVLQVHLPYQAVLANWETEVWHLEQGVAGALLFVALLTLLLYRQQQHRHATQSRISSEIALAARVFDDSYDGIVITDAQLHILRINAAFTRTTGYSAEEAQGKTPSLLSSGSHGAGFYKTMWDSILHHGGWQGEVVNRRKNGELYHERLAISTVRDASGLTTHYIGMFADISGHKRQEAALQQALDRAESANQAKSQFLAVMSHEIRTPLNGILGMAQLLQMAEVTPAERVDYAATILDSGQVLLTLLNDILDLSKVEAGKMELTITPTDPTRMLQDTVTLFSKTAQRKGLLLHVDGPALPHHCYGIDALRLKQMLANLISNAIKFTTQGEICLRVQELQRQGNQARLKVSVSDTGIGIPANKLAELFRPFSQVDSSTTRRFGGTGLGLSIVANLATLMGGEVGVESTEGHGACFWFTLSAPVLVPSVPTPRPIPESEMPASAPDTPTPPNTRILIAEDNPVNRKFIQIMLTRLGYTQLQMAENGAEAVQHIQAGEYPGLVLMDCQMPVMDGYEATRQIRQWQRTQREAGHTPPEIPIVALTAAAFDNEREACLAAGMDDFLAKPVAMQALQDMLRHWVPPHGH